MSSSVPQGWWGERRPRILQIAIVLMLIISPHRLVVGFSRLLWEQAPAGAVDLQLRYNEVHNWFAGISVYGNLLGATYPPASYLMLWPFLGWLRWTAAQWLWAAATVVALGWLTYLIVRESCADAPLERLFVGLLPFSMYATSVAVGNGQLIVPLLPALVAGLVLLRGRQRECYENWLAGLLILMALVSPTISAPFFWIVVFVPHTFWPAALVSLGYGVLTVLAASFQWAGSVSLLHEWHAVAVRGASWGSVHGGYANLHTWLAALGLRTWDRSASLLVLAALGGWTYRHRHADLWLLLGVAALVSRLWTYHRLYDDLLILLPMITLFRIAKQRLSVNGSGVVASVLLAASWVAVLSPPRLLDFPPSWNWLFEAEQTVVWVAMLAFLTTWWPRD